MGLDITLVQQALAIIVQIDTDFPVLSVAIQSLFVLNLALLAFWKLSDVLMNRLWSQ